MRLIDADALSETLKQMIQQADMKILENTMALVTSPHYKILKKQIEEILNGLSKFPAVEQQEWIPVKERLPEEKGEYLVTYHPCYWDNIQQDIKVGIDSFRGKTSWAKKKHQIVIAWMPLPEPWKGENNEVE